MRKTDKKTDREIIRQLTDLCEAAKDTHPGFIWLTHEVNYQRFPQSLKVVLVFDDEVSEASLLSEFRDLIPQVQAALEPVIGTLLPAGQIEARREHLLH
ncbi:hypothetical protein CWE12_09650 [Aliidiomarina sedimenti]|uniref:Fis family transcriptional regulator n=1 Tax=Aliidiomarina sedimenti TaxID=1933879 RepID=A0ABY0BXN6_9GAMM|nr:hypothetical protein [Aliidiomarina sedimenti]RUO29239.1 hypothetical protein CWE12_09650 [Aliidiomarina sedimenti]